jgi:hypothetical protein
MGRPGECSVIESRKRGYHFVKRVEKVSQIGEIWLKKRPKEAGDDNDQDKIG